jgi:hypothetical protein
MRLSSFILDVQRIAPADIPTGHTFTCESSPTGSLNTDVSTMNLNNIRLFQGATLEHVDTLTSNGVFHNVIVSGTVTRENVWTGDRLKMTGSFSGRQESSDSAIAFHILMLADSEFIG